jgi:hypothetical protein
VAALKHGVRPSLLFGWLAITSCDLGGIGPVLLGSHMGCALLAWRYQRLSVTILALVGFGFILFVECGAME